MSESKSTKLRKCSTCEQEIESTAKEIKTHAKLCVKVEAK